MCVWGGGGYCFLFGFYPTRKGVGWRFPSERRDKQRWMSFSLLHLAKRTSRRARDIQHDENERMTERHRLTIQLFLGPPTQAHDISGEISFGIHRYVFLTLWSRFTLILPLRCSLFCQSVMPTIVSGQTCSVLFPEPLSWSNGACGRFLP